MAQGYYPDSIPSISMSIITLGGGFYCGKMQVRKKVPDCFLRRERDSDDSLQRYLAAACVHLIALQMNEYQQNMRFLLNEYK